MTDEHWKTPNILNKNGTQTVCIGSMDSPCYIADKADLSSYNE